MDGKLDGKLGGKLDCKLEGKEEATAADAIELIIEFSLEERGFNFSRLWRASSSFKLSSFNWLLTNSICSKVSSLFFNKEFEELMRSPVSEVVIPSWSSKRNFLEIAIKIKEKLV